MLLPQQKSLTISTILAVAIYPLISNPKAAGDKKAAHATKTADIPPIELRAATIWGISVIATFFDKNVPINPPIEIPATIKIKFERELSSRLSIVTVNAISIPDIPR